MINLFKKGLVNENLNINIVKVVRSDDGWILLVHEKT